jgi:hypothetical protein
MYAGLDTMTLIALPASYWRGDLRTAAVWRKDGQFRDMAAGRIAEDSAL